jgi:hypothetical protein
MSAACCFAPRRIAAIASTRIPAYFPRRAAALRPEMYLKGRGPADIPPEKPENSKG